VAAEAKRVAHHMSEPGGLQLCDGSEADGWIDVREAWIGRHLLPAQCLDAEDGFNGAARSQRVAEKSFRAGERRHAFAEQRLQRLRFRRVIIARARAVG